MKQTEAKKLTTIVLRKDQQQFGAKSFILRLSDACGDVDRRLLLVHGYLNNDKARADYQPMIDEARSGGWRGEIHGVVWDGGDTMEKLQAIAKKIALSLIPVPGPHSILIPVRLGYGGYQIRKYWADACKRADQTGLSLGNYLVRESEINGGAAWTVAAHSLGCRVAFEAMCRASVVASTTIFDNVLLFGGAVSTTCDWIGAQKSVQGNIVNCFSQRDRVLRFFFQLAEWRSPIGLNSIPSAHSKVCNHNCTEDVPNHFAYHCSFNTVLRSLADDD